jgi:hypothetical protein
MEGIGRRHELENAMELADAFFNKHPRFRKPPRRNAQAKPRITGLPLSQRLPSSLEVETPHKKPDSAALFPVVTSIDKNEACGASINTVGERPAFPKTFSKINTAYRILHHTLIKHREMMTFIS